VGKVQPMRSRLTREFEKVALERPENSEAARQRFLADVEGLVEVPTRDVRGDFGGPDLGPLAGDRGRSPLVQ
jgi:hypothetical protein